MSGVSEGSNGQRNNNKRQTHKLHDKQYLDFDYQRFVAKAKEVQQIIDKKNKKCFSNFILPFENKVKQNFQQQKQKVAQKQVQKTDIQSSSEKSKVIYQKKFNQKRSSLIEHNSQLNVQWFGYNVSVIYSLIKQIKAECLWLPVIINSNKYIFIDPCQEVAKNTQQFNLLKELQKNKNPIQLIQTNFGNYQALLITKIKLNNELNYGEPNEIKDNMKKLDKQKPLYRKMMNQVFDIANKLQISSITIPYLLQQKSKQHCFYQCQMILQSLQMVGKKQKNKKKVEIIICLQDSQKYEWISQYFLSFTKKVK